MNIVQKRNLVSNLLAFVFTTLFFLTFSVQAQDADPAKGKELFMTNCTACHQLDAKLIGPPLKNVAERRSEEWILSMVNNPTEWVQKDPEAKKLFEEYNKVPMTPFPQLTKEDVQNIIAYTSVGDEGIEEETAAAPVAVPGAGNPIYQDLEAQNSNWWWQPLVVLLFIVLVYFLAKKKQNFAAIFFSIVGVFTVAYFLFGYLMQIGVDTGYKPIQPIEFSHKVHAGDNAIDCEYCHSSAKHSKSSGIPSTNVCMNCHKFIKEYNGEVYGEYDKEFFDAEIAKVYESAGWDVTKFAYTSEGKPIEWTRVHNLPDFVYYNHSQHVNVAGLECQTCHGPVEEMHRVEQFSPLTMDWCISCHRDTEVKMDENGYYQGTYEALQEAHKGATVADMGGLECSKCHY